MDVTPKQVDKTLHRRWCIIRVIIARGVTRHNTPDDLNVHIRITCMFGVSLHKQKSGKNWTSLSQPWMVFMRRNSYFVPSGRQMRTQGLKILSYIDSALYFSLMNIDGPSITSTGTKPNIDYALCLRIYLLGQGTDTLEKLGLQNFGKMGERVGGQSAFLSIIPPVSCLVEETTSTIDGIM